MNEESLNMSLRKFLKVVGVTSQQEIEKAIRAAVADGTPHGQRKRSGADGADHRQGWAHPQGRRHHRTGLSAATPSPRHCAGRRRPPSRAALSPRRHSDRRRHPPISARRPPAMSRLSLTLCARPSGSNSSRSETSAGVCLPQTQKPPSPSSISPALRVALGGRHHVGAEAGRRAGRLVAQRAARDRDAELEPDHVDRPVERGVSAALVRQHGVFLEAAARVVGLALDHHVGAEREMMRHVAAVAVDRRGHFGDAGLLQRAAVALRLADVGELEARRRRKAQAVASAAPGRWRCTPPSSRCRTWCRRRTS